MHITIHFLVHIPARKLRDSVLRLIIRIDKDRIKILSDRQCCLTVNRLKSFYHEIFCMSVAETFVRFYHRVGVMIMNAFEVFCFNVIP